MLATQIPLWYLPTVCFWSWRPSVSLTWAILSQHVVSSQRDIFFSPVPSAVKHQQDFVFAPDGEERHNGAHKHVSPTSAGKLSWQVCAALPSQRNQQSTATGTQAFWLCLSPRIVCAFAAAITVTFTQKRASQWHRFGAIISRWEVWSGPLRPCFLIFMRCAMPLCGQSQPRLFQTSLSTSVLPLTGEHTGYAGKRKSWNFGFHSKAFN